MTGGTPVIAPVERILHLKAVPALDRLPQVLLGAIGQRTTERLFRQGNLIIDPDRPVAATYVVVDGLVAISATGRPRADIGPNQAVGFLEFLARLEGGVEARAASDVLALELDCDSHLELCDEHFAILHAHLQYLAARLSVEMAGLPDGTRLGSERARQLTFEPGLDLVQRVLALGHDDAFAASSPDALVELARHAVEVGYDAGNVLWHRGDQSAGFFLLTAGTVICEPASARRWICDPTVALGLHEALAELQRAYDALAHTPVTGLELRLEPVLDILEDHLELGMDLMSRLARRLLGFSSTAQ